MVKLTNELRLMKVRMTELTEKDASFAMREAELSAALDEAADQSDLDTVTAEMDEFEREKGDHDGEKQKLSEKIEAVEAEIEGLRAKQKQADEPAAPAVVRTENKVMEVRGDMTLRKTRDNPLGQTRTEREAYLARAEVREFYENLMQLAGEKRAVNGSELGIPELMMGFFRDAVADYSVLMKHVSLRRLHGDGKALIAGEIPEAVWTECCANINELNIDFSAMYVYCHKVAGYIPVCNATLEDFGGVDGIPTLASEVEYNLLKAIGYALDKAIAYGNGTDMPLGFVRSLPMTSNPVKPTETWPAYAANVAVATGTGAALFKNIMKIVANANDHGSTGGLTIAMSKKTWLAYIAPESLTFNAAGTLVAAANRSFPVIGGTVEFLPFIPDGDIIGGYLGNYILAERAGIHASMSEHVFFLQDNAVFKATARYDGSPIVPYRDSFFVINVNGGTPATSLTFAADTANADETP